MPHCLLWSPRVAGVAPVVVHVITLREGMSFFVHYYPISWLHRMQQVVTVHVMSFLMHRYHPYGEPALFSQESLGPFGLSKLKQQRVSSKGKHRNLRAAMDAWG